MKLIQSLAHVAAIATLTGSLAACDAGRSTKDVEATKKIKPSSYVGSGGYNNTPDYTIPDPYASTPVPPGMQQQYVGPSVYPQTQLPPGTSVQPITQPVNPSLPVNLPDNNNPPVNPQVNPSNNIGPGPGLPPLPSVVPSGLPQPLPFDPNIPTITLRLLPEGAVGIKFSTVAGIAELSYNVRGDVGTVTTPSDAQGNISVPYEPKVTLKFRYNGHACTLVEPVTATPKDFKGDIKCI